MFGRRRRSQTVALEALRARGQKLEAALARVEARQRRSGPFPLAEIILAAVAGISVGAVGSRLRRRRKLERELRKLQHDASRTDREWPRVAS